MDFEAVFMQSQKDKHMTITFQKSPQQLDLITLQKRTKLFTNTKQCSFPQERFHLVLVDKQDAFLIENTKIKWGKHLLDRTCQIA